jgi:hypothetical protein
MGQKIKLNNIKSLIDSNTVLYSDSPSFLNPKIRVLTSNVKFLLSDGKTLSIGKGFEWDEVSVPYILQWAFPKSGKYAISALVHDALYYKTYKSQKFADDEFKKWMDVTINPVQSWLRWMFVRIVGGIFWKKNIKNPSSRVLWNQDCIKIYQSKNKFG